MRSNNHTRMRKSTKYFYYILSIILIIISISTFVINFSKENAITKKEEIYRYSNKFNYDYQINLVDNDYINESVLTDKSLAYVTDLIDTTDMNLNYEYDADKETDLEYRYSITSRLLATYTRDGEEQKIIDEEEILLEEQTENTYGNQVLINEELQLDLKDKNDLLKEFEQEMSMDITAKYIISLKVDVSTSIEGKDVKSNYETQIQIDLAEKTTNIYGENNTEDTETISNEYQINSDLNIVVIFIDIILIIVAIGIINHVRHSKTANIVRNEFKQELNKLLKLCEDKIVTVNEKPSDKGEKIIQVKDFAEIVKASDELFKPILYYFDAQKEEAWFSVITETVTYRYVMKRNNIK